MRLAIYCTVLAYVFNIKISVFLSKLVASNRFAFA